MKEYKFRGKAVLEEDDSVELTDKIVKHGDWVYGNLIFTENGTPYIVGELVEATDEYTSLHFWIPVDCVGQFTGLKDKNGVEIYEGDVVKATSKLQVFWNDDEKYLECANGAFVGWAVKSLIDDNFEAEFTRHLAINCEVIGNIHDKENI